MLVQCLSYTRHLGHSPKDAPNTTSYWKILKTVKQKEGIKGLYKGEHIIYNQGCDQKLTSVVSGIFVNLSVGIAPWATVLIGYGLLRTLPKAAPYLVVGAAAQFGWQVLTTLITLPFEILAIRTLAVPHSTPIISPLSNLRLLLTADERSHPFRSLWTPSRILASFLPTIIGPLSAALILPQAMKLGEQQGLLVYLISQLILAVGLRTPLAVLAARLNAQRTGGTGAAIVHQKGEENAAVEGIIQVRPTPYRNLWDCAKTIVAEEGWYALWRGWPLELLLALRSTA